MDIVLKRINEYKEVIRSQKQFDAFFSSLQSVKRESDLQELTEFIFLLETQIITAYYHRIVQNLEIIAVSEPNLINPENKKELSTIAVKQLTRILEKYHYQRIDLLLKCATLPPVQKNHSD